MKRMVMIIALCGPLSVVAQDRFTFRDNDPFLFCHDGMKVLAPCWVPVKPYTGTFMYTGLCQPSTAGRAWTSDDWRGLIELVRICPKAITSGEWDSKGGRSDMVPSEH